MSDRIDRLPPDSCTYPVTEKFISINGEGQRAGQIAAFIRFRCCNLNCSYCDTRFSCTPDAPCDFLSADEIAAFIRQSGVHCVTLTGGEPLLQPHLRELLLSLASIPSLQVEIETNGSLPIEAFCGPGCRPAFTLDYKLPSSGMENHMLTENYRFLQPQDTVKFVAGSPADLQRMEEIAKKYRLEQKCRVLVSPVFGSIEPAQIVDFLISHQLSEIRLQLQLHKFIWKPDKRGV
ncbi:MAG: putative 7-carboxy-7-deazaguanine synthase QueE [Lachnospiraceae bacterium]|nr:putative 7-carboxy-7-deazaguanine synthase QueE [Lachnospiraceae bacterium]